MAVAIPAALVDGRRQTVTEDGAASLAYDQTDKDEQSSKRRCLDHVVVTIVED